LDGATFLSQFAGMQGCGTRKQCLLTQMKIFMKGLDSFSLCYPSHDIASECVRGTKHMFKQVF